MCLNLSVASTSGTQYIGISIMFGYCEDYLFNGIEGTLYNLTYMISYQLNQNYLRIKEDIDLLLRKNGMSTTSRSI